jgi:hypothetical protein
VRWWRLGEIQTRKGSLFHSFVSHSRALSQFNSLVNYLVDFFITFCCFFFALSTYAACKCVCVYLPFCTHFSFLEAFHSPRNGSAVIRQDLCQFIPSSLTAAYKFILRFSHERGALRVCVLKESFLIFILLYLSIFCKERNLHLHFNVVVYRKEIMKVTFL